MPKIVVEGPDGRKFAFPDTMPRAEINAFMKQKYGTKAPNESVQDYLARYGREQAATEARAKDIDREATAVGRAEGERAAGRMGVSNPLEMAFAAPAIGLAQQEGGRRVFEREGTVLADEAAGLSAANAAAFFVPGMVNKQFGAQLEEGRRQQPLAAFAGDIAGGFGPGEIIGAGVSKAVQAIGPGMAALGRMFARGPGPDTTNAIVGGTLGGIAPAETPEERARNVAVGAGLGAVARPVSKMAADFTTPGAPNAMPDAVPAGGYFGRQSLRPPGSGPSAREIETQQQWSTATPIVSQARTTAQSAQQAADAALQSKAPADIARAKDQKKALVGQLQEAQASRAGMDTPEDARLAETLASLAENTSDPVLLSTQISAAKTSLDRLLTDIGSPVEGNLIPVKTQILTRTQAPRSAAEPAPERASVTRYAEGSDEVKPQGFGASTPNTPQQAARFETPGSPEYEAAVAKGLDMSQAGRMGRAKEMGYTEEGYIPMWEKDDYGASGEWTRKNKQRVFTTAREAEGNIVRTQEANNEIFGFNPQASDGRLLAARKAMYETPEYKSGNMEEWRKTPEYEAYKQIEKLLDRQAARGNALARVELVAARLGQRLNIPGGRIVGVDEIFGPIKKGKLSPDVTSYGETTVMLPVTRFIDDALQGKNLEKTVRKYIFDEFGEDALLENPREVETYIKSLLNAAEWVRNRKLSDEVESYARWYAGEGTDKAMPGIAAPDRPPTEIMPPSIMRVLVKRDKDGNIENIRSVNAAFDPDKATSSTLLAAAPFAAVGGAGLTSERELGNKMKRDKKD